MAKKESPDNKKESFAPQVSVGPSKISWLSNKTFGIIKFILGICLLPAVYSSSVSFFNEFSVLARPLQNYFWAGIISLVLVYLFVWEPAMLYQKGHRVLEIIFSFFKPLVNVAPNLLPIHTIIALIAYGILSIFIKADWLIRLFLFIFGFTLSLHLVFAAKSIRGKKDFLRANYIFGFSLIYIINLLLLCFCLNLIFAEFSFVNYFNNTFQIARNIFYTIFRQLFLS